MRINWKCLSMKSILLQMYIDMILGITTEVTDNKIHQIFKVKSNTKMPKLPTLCITGKLDYKLHQNKLLKHRQVSIFSDKKSFGEQRKQSFYIDF